MPVSVIKCSDCPKELSTHKFWGLHAYLLEDKQTVHVYKTIGWCESCCELELIEEIPDKKEVYEQFVTSYDELQKLESHFKKTIFGSLKFAGKDKVEEYEIYKKELEEKRVAIEWQKNRTAKQKCLTCGSTNIIHMDVFDNTSIHPGCGGTFTVEQMDYRFSVRMSKKFYDPEGVFLREEEL